MHGLRKYYCQDRFLSSHFFSVKKMPKIIIVRIKLFSGTYINYYNIVTHFFIILELNAFII